MQQDNDYLVEQRIGSGSFGSIFLGTCKKTGEKVAIKLESLETKHPQLPNEYEIYQTLRGMEGIPEIKWFGIQGEYRVLVMELLGFNLEELFNKCQRTFSLKTVLMLAEQLINRIAYLHSRNIIHRDIKPENFVVDYGVQTKVVRVIDFGLSLKFQEAIPYEENQTFTGTAKFASINTHLGIQQAHRDDMESVGFILIYFIRGKLPWSHIEATNYRQKMNYICEKIVETSVPDLCRGLPPEFQTYLEYCRGLEFEERPDYDYIKELFRNLAKENGITYDFIFDWDLKELDSIDDEATYTIPSFIHK